MPTISVPAAYLPSVSRQYRWNDFVLDLDAFRLERAACRSHSSPRPLTCWCSGQPARPCVYQAGIFDALWADTAVTDHALTRVVAQLRRVLGDEARQARYLETVPTRGYRWICPVETGDAPASPPLRSAGSNPSGLPVSSPGGGNPSGLPVSPSGGGVAPRIACFFTRRRPPFGLPVSPSGGGNSLGLPVRSSDSQRRTIAPGLGAALVLLVTIVGIVAWFQRSAPAEASTPGR